jgi:hypothetical protein
MSEDPEKIKKAKRSLRFQKIEFFGWIAFGVPYMLTDLRNWVSLLAFLSLYAIIKTCHTDIEAMKGKIESMTNP